MTVYLRQSTASQEVPLGHFVDETDGKTAETALTIANTDIKIWKTGATTLANKNSGGATHISGGIYYAVLDATDTDTIGPLVIFVHVSGALPCRLECVVLDEAVYDVQFGTTAPSTYAGGDTSGTTTLLSRLSAARAGYLDNLNIATLKKNTAFSAFEFVMTDSTNHNPLTGATVTATRSIDGAAFGACANAVAEVASGVYKIDLAAADLNGNCITLRFTAASADDRLVTVFTQP